MQLAELLDRVVPVLAFLLCLTVLAEVSERVGLFDHVARWAARLARGRVVTLWLLVVLISVLTTTVLSLDTTAVLVTPVVLALAAQLQLDRAMLAYTAVWLANTASLVLPVANLTNLLAWHRLGQDSLSYARLIWPAALTSVLITVLVLAIVFRGSLRGRYRIAPPRPADDKVLLVVAGVACGGLGPAILFGAPIVLAAGVAALTVVVACILRRKPYLEIRMVPWQLIIGVLLLFVVVQAAHAHGLGALLNRTAGSGEGLGSLLQLGGVSALAANVANNLPAYLALEPATDGSALRSATLLVGVNSGPLITPWASLAILLWARRCRAAGVPVHWGRFVLRGLVLVPLVVAGSVLALWVWHR